MVQAFSGHSPVLARRGAGALLQALWTGDFVAWSIVGGIVVIWLVIIIIKRVSNTDG